MLAESELLTLDNEPKISPPVNPVRYKAAILWMHHILATSKRKEIVKTAEELSLSGVSKVGHPGAVFIEGIEANVDAFVAHIKSLRWQACQLRSEYQVDTRLLDWKGIREVDAISQVKALLLNEHGERFLEAMKVK